MSNSTTNLDLIAVNQAQKEVSVNALLDAASPAMLYGRRAQTSGGLVWGYFGGTALLAGVPTQIANGTITLTASATNYLEADPATGAVSKNTTGFTSGSIPLYQIVAGASTVTSYTDMRAGVLSAVDPAVAAASAITAHEAASDPHPQYLTQTEGDARYALESAIGVANGIASLGSDGKVPSSQLPASGSSGTVTSVSVTTANGVSGSVATSTTTPAITLTLGAITPTSVAASGTVTGSNLSGTNTGDQTSVSGNAGTATTLATSRNIDGQAFNGSADITVIAPGTHAATGKATPVDADEMPLVDSAASNVLKKLTWANLKATLKTYFDTLYATVSQPFDIHTFYPGVPGASAKLYRGKLARAVTFPGNFSVALFPASFIATAITVFDIQKIGKSVGYCTIDSGGTTPTFASTSGASVSFAAGDIFAVIAPATPDATLADPAITCAGTR
jgi:hypothetical protein